MNKLNKEQVLQIKDMRVEGKTTTEIGKALNVSTHTIGYWVKRLKASGHDVTTSSRRGKKAITL